MSMSLSQWGLKRGVRYLLLVLAWSLHANEARAQPFTLTEALPSNVGYGNVDHGAFATDGPRILVGRPSAPLGELSGKVFVFERPLPTSTFTLLQTLQAPDVVRRDYFGTKVALQSGRIIVVADPSSALDDPPVVDTTHAPRIYVFERNGGNYQHVQRIDPPETNPNQNFGASIALVGDRLVVGSPYYPDQTPDRVYIYLRDPVTHSYVLVQTVTKSSTSNFGHALAAWGDELLVGEPSYRASNNAYVGGAQLYRWNPGQQRYDFRQQLMAPLDSQGQYDYFGQAVALEGGVAFIGAPGHDPVVQGSGTVFVYRADAAGNYSSFQTLASVAPTLYDNFGGLVSAAGGRLLVKEQVFEADANGFWALVQRLTDQGGAFAGGRRAMIPAQIVIGAGSSQVLVFQGPAEQVTTPAAVPALGWPHLAALSSLLTFAAMRRRRRYWSLAVACSPSKL
jgi:hypothetical protein